MGLGKVIVRSNVPEGISFKSQLCPHTAFKNGPGLFSSPYKVYGVEILLSSINSKFIYYLYKQNLIFY